MQEIDPQKLSERKRLQIEIVLKESELKKYEREKLLLEVETRTLKSKLAQTEMEITQKQIKAKRNQDQLMILQNEIIKLKHKMNFLH